MAVVELGNEWAGVGAVGTVACTVVVAVGDHSRFPCSPSTVAAPYADQIHSVTPAPSHAVPSTDRWDPARRSKKSTQFRWWSWGDV